MTLGRLTSRHRWLPGFFLVIVLVSGCASQTRALLETPPLDLPQHTELAQTPFFPQESYQCGPAALAMVLTQAGIQADPDALVSQVYLPQRKGSLQLEMLAATRRQGAISLIIPPRLDALLAEVAAGHPVVVLQNLGLSFAPVWHYAVVVGYDLRQHEIILRSGTTKRLTMPMSTFEHTWARSQRWALVVLAPGELPKTADEHSIATALVAFERDNNGLPVYRSYLAALGRWPHHLTLLIGAGNAAFSLNDYNAAERHFAFAVAQHPQSTAALNNLSLTLAHQGRFNEARAMAARALALGSTWTATVDTTLGIIDILEAGSKSMPRN